MAVPLPRLFISCVSDEFRTIRRKVEETVRHLGYEPVTMENWSSGHGELIAWLRGQIDSCDGLIQITGIAYGAEPPHPDPAAHGIPGGPDRYSYTQFEFLYAAAIGKKTWIIQPGSGCTRDTPPDRLDLPRDPANPNPTAWQAERRQLQSAYLRRLKDGNHLRHQPTDDKELQILILKLRDHAEELRLDFSRWQDFVAADLQRVEGKVNTLHRTLPWIVAGIAAVACLLLWVKSSSDRTSADVRTVIARQDQQTGMLEEHSNLLKEAVVQLEKLTQENATLGIKITDLPREDFEKELAARTGVSPVELRLHIEAGRRSQDALIRARSNLLAGKLSEAIAAAEEVEKADSAAIARMIESLRIKAEAFYQSVDYEKALAARQRVAALTDRATQPVAWCDAQHLVAFLLQLLARYDEAVRLLEQVISVKERELGPDDHSVAVSLINLGDLLRSQGKLAEAEPLLRRALAINERKLPPNDPDLAKNLNALGHLLSDQGKSDEAEPLYRRALDIAETAHGKDDPGITTCLNNLAILLAKKGDTREAEILYRRAITIDEIQLRPDHPSLAIPLSNLASLLGDKGKSDEAERLYRRSIQISETSLGANHPTVAVDLNNLALLLNKQGRPGDAIPLYQRAIAIDEEKSGKDHPALATTLNNLANLLMDQGEPADATPFYRRAVLIAFLHRKRNGTPFEHERLFIGNYVAALKKQGRNEKEIIDEFLNIKREAGLE